MAIEIDLNHNEREVLSEYLTAHGLDTATELVRGELQRFKEDQKREQLHELAHKIWSNHEPDRGEFA